MSVIRLSGISCEKQNRQLFSDLDLQVNAGELLYLRGENGAGKTSLLRILVGLSMPQSGQVFFNNIDVRQNPETLSNLIYVGHKPGNSPSLSAVTNISLWCKQLNIIVNHQSIIETLGLLQLDGLEDLPIRHLSAGQQRRVALARLWLHNKANLWVLDEPFTALDVHSVSQLSEHIGSFVNAGGCVVMTSHQPATINCPQKEFVLEYAW